MTITNSILRVAVLFSAGNLAGCQPHDPPPDLIKTQREALNKAKGLEAQLQQQADAQRRAVDDAEK